MVDQDEGRQAEHGRHHLLPAKGHHLGGRQQQQEVGHQNCASHEEPMLAALLSSTRMQGSPAGVDQVGGLAKGKAVVGSERGVVKAPVEEVV